MKIATFNISGGFYIGNEETEYLDRQAASKVDNKLLRDIIDIINRENIDVITFQEIITTDSVEYIKSIENATELKYSVAYELSPCNLVENTNCGLAVMSKYPIEEIKKGIFTNPNLSKTTSSGNTYYTYDKGWLSCKIENLSILTHHGFPYRRFNSSPEANPSVFDEFDNIIKEGKYDIVTGDFNANDFMTLMTYTSSKYKRAFNETTTVDNQKFDDILLYNERTCNKQIIKSFSDHYLLMIEI